MKTLISAELFEYKIQLCNGIKHPIIDIPLTINSLKEKLVCGRQALRLNFLPALCNSKRELHN